MLHDLCRRLWLSSALRRAIPLLRGFFGLLWATTAIGKLLDPVGFAQVIGTYQLGLPAVLLLPAGLALSLGELALGGAMLAGRRQRSLAAVTLVLQLGYTLLAAVTLLRGISLQNCGCFGVFLARPLRVQTLVEDAVLSLLALGLWSSKRSAQRGGSRAEAGTPRSAPPVG